MGRGKRLAGIADAVNGILGSEATKKKLKKKKALRSFIGKMERKRAEIRAKLEKVGGGKREELVRNIETLDKQIAKAGKILSDMNS